CGLVTQCAWGPTPKRSRCGARRLALLAAAQGCRSARPQALYLSSARGAPPPLAAAAGSLLSALGAPPPSAAAAALEDSLSSRRLKAVARRGRRRSTFLVLAGPHPRSLPLRARYSVRLGPHPQAQPLRRSKTRSPRGG